MQKRANETTRGEAAIKNTRALVKYGWLTRTRSYDTQKACAGRFRASLLHTEVERRTATHVYAGAAGAPTLSLSLALAVAPFSLALSLWSAGCTAAGFSLALLTAQTRRGLALSLYLALTRTLVGASTTTTRGVYIKSTARILKRERGKPRCVTHGSKHQNGYRDSREMISSFATDDGHFTRRETDSIRAGRKRAGARASFWLRGSCARALTAFARQIQIATSVRVTPPRQTLLRGPRAALPSMAVVVPGRLVEKFRKGLRRAFGTNRRLHWLFLFY